MKIKTSFSRQIRFTVLSIITIFLNCLCSRPSGNQNVVVSLSKMNVMYMGVDNPAMVAINNVQASDISITTNNGTVKKTGDAYIFRPATKGSEILTILVKGKVVNTREYRVKSLPDPVAKVAGLHGGEVNKSDLSKAVELVAEQANSDFEYKFIVNEFTVSAMVGKLTYSKTSHNNKIGKEMQKLINMAEKGSKLCFDEIKVSGPEGVSRTIDPIIFVLK